MSTMKSYLTTLDLVMQDKVKPETVVEEDEVEETLTINEDGELINELKSRPNRSSGSWWSGDLDASEFAIKDAASKVDDFKSFPKDPKPNFGDVEGSKLAKPKAKQPAEKREFKVRQGPTVWRGNPNINPDPEGLTGREAEHDDRGMKDWYAHNKRIQKRKDKLSGKQQDEPMEPMAMMEPMEPALKGPALSRREQLEKALGHKMDPDSDWINPNYPDTPVPGMEPLAKPKRTLGDKLKALPGWYLDSLKDAGSSLYKAYAPQGVKDYANRRKDAFSKIMQDDISLEEFTDSANFLLEDYELAKQEQLNDLRRLSGLKEAEDVWAYSPIGKGIVARVVETDDGLFQVYVEGPKGWIAQGQPHKTQAEAEKDAKSFFESAEKKIVEDWGSSDWTVAMKAMWDSLLKQHNGKVTPETMESAAEEVIMMHGEQMGYDEDSHDDGVSQVISMFLNRQDGIKNSDMVGLANDTWQHSEKTKYM